MGLLSAVDLVLTPLYAVVGAILAAVHGAVSPLLGEADGVAWVLAILGLATLTRLLTFPFHLRRLESDRAMLRLEPRLRQLQHEHATDRERLGEETVRLRRAAGFHPGAVAVGPVAVVPVGLLLWRLLAGSAPVGPSALRSATLGDHVALASAATQGAEALVLGAALVVTTVLATYAAQRAYLRHTVEPEGRLHALLRMAAIQGLAHVVVLALLGLVVPVGVLAFWAATALGRISQAMTARL